VRLCLLGPLALEEDGAPVPSGSPKERRVLARLAIAANRVVSEDALIDALWGDEPPRSATRSLQAHVSRLRSTLIAGGDSGLRIQTEPS
jgi:DNA-binding SARP family transcriptional activator